MLNSTVNLTNHNTETSLFYDNQNITFDTIINDVTFEIGHWNNLSGTLVDFTGMKIMSFSITKQ